MHKQPVTPTTGVIGFAIGAIVAIKQRLPRITGETMSLMIIAETEWRVTPTTGVITFVIN